MPRYFFDVSDAGKLTRDPVGIDLADGEEARGEALGLLPNLARDAVSDGDQHEIVVSVRDEAGVTVYEASLSLSGRWWPGRR